MKIATLLTQYLYTKHRLDLPGIGTFFLDPNFLTTIENKQRSNVLEGISFESKPLLKDSPDLIAYISAESGKMKALATADLESHLELAQQFLNIGKPFMFEGIGTLVKIRNGEFDFLPGTISPERIKEQTTTPNRQGQKEDSSKYESFLSEPKSSGPAWRMPVIAILVLAGLGLAIWGGYAISKRAKSGDTPELNANAASLMPAPDSTANKVDTAALAKLAKPAPTNYKYILEVAKNPRAFKRYKQLRTNLWDVKLETEDSMQYKLVLLLPIVNSDTTRVLDSLTAMTGKRVYIEHQN